MICKQCGLHQLSESVDTDELYRNYWYHSSLNKSMVIALNAIAMAASSYVRLAGDDVVVDIGCNDGQLLRWYRRDLKTVGFDPARNLKPWGIDYFSNHYFSKAGYAKNYGRPAKIVTAIAMFYDLDDPIGFLEQVHEILDPNGIFVLQMTDLAGMLWVNAWDNICHEHVIYWDFDNLCRALRRTGFTITAVETNRVNGFSVRVFARKVRRGRTGGWPVDISARKYRDWSRMVIKINKDYRDEVDGSKSGIAEYTRALVGNGKVIDVLGASTKGNTLLQVCDIGENVIRWAAEINPDKFGLSTVGTNIPIVGQEQSMRNAPDYYLVLPWHFRETFMAKMKGSKSKLIFPLPELETITP